jgi:YD repeat-containing protein
VTPAGGGTALVTSYGYDAVGQLTSVTYPGQGPITYAYDAAHRLTGITDAAGNSVTYTLDNAGNRTAEETKDASGTLARTITRAFDALNRVQSSSGGIQ